MPHIVIDYQRLTQLRHLVAEWDREDEGSFNIERWTDQLVPILRAVADERAELPDGHRTDPPARDMPITRIEA